MKRLNIPELEKYYKNLEILCFEDTKWSKKEITEGKYLKKIFLPQILEEVDKLILLPCLKTHRYADFTGSIKLSMGFTRQRDRLKFHTHKLQEKIAELNRVINPDLIIMDARKCFINGGPDIGEIAQPNLLLASTQRRDIDLRGIEIIQGFKGNSLAKVRAEELPQIKNFK